MWRGAGPSSGGGAAAAALVFYGALAALVSLGLRDVLLAYEENRCSMTYMFEYPEYLVGDGTARWPRPFPWARQLRARLPSPEEDPGKCFQVPCCALNSNALEGLARPELLLPGGWQSAWVTSGARAPHKLVDTPASATFCSLGRLSWLQPAGALCTRVPVLRR